MSRGSRKMCQKHCVFGTFTRKGQKNIIKTDTLRIVRDSFWGALPEPLKFYGEPLWTNDLNFLMSLALWTRVGFRRTSAAEWHFFL